MKHLPDISFKSIKHKSQRYCTVGDYYFKGKELQVRVSKMNEDYEFLVLVHELIEWFLIKKKDIPIKKIDQWDMNCDDVEPGNNPKAPYYEEHKFATSIEKKLAKKIGVNWDEYSFIVDSL